ncbi:MAG: hypothetical protein JNK87_11900 [Bryobacterales bacterium]|nr:hypothetical protein [Bryobacterales bacterium]
MWNSDSQATDDFNRRWGALGTELVQTLNAKGTGKHVDEAEILRQGIAYHDARNYIILGDPAVCLRAAEMPAVDA